MSGSKVMQELIVRGSLLVDDQPSTDQKLLLISADMERLLAVTTTGAGGQFEFALPAQGDTEAIILAKITGGFVGPVHWQVDLPQPAALEISVDTKNSFNVEVTVESSAGYPERLDVFLDPVTVDGVPEQLQRFFKQEDQGVFSSHFLEVPIDKAFSFRVSAGTYKIGAHYIVEERPMMDDPAFKNFVTNTAEVLPERDHLEGDPYGGFALTVNEDVNLVLSLRVLDDEELFGRDG
jgi:hypothetical protein